jgi:hypothetical protein
MRQELLRTAGAWTAEYASRVRHWVGASLSLVSLVGCVSTLKVGDRVMDKSDTESAFRLVKERAAFEARCPVDQLAVTILEAYRFQNAERARQIGIDGCGHRLVYVRVDTTSGMYGSSGTTWVLDSASSRAGETVGAHAVTGAPPATQGAVAAPPPSPPPPPVLTPPR